MKPSPSSQTIDNVLRNSILAFDVRARREAATSIEGVCKEKGTTFDAHVLDNLIRHFGKIQVRNPGEILTGNRAHEQVKQSLLDGSWFSAIRTELTDKTVRRIESSQWGDGDSSMDFVTEDNPYGWWSKPTYDDHDQPTYPIPIKAKDDHNHPSWNHDDPRLPGLAGKSNPGWNHYRQCYNLSEREFSDSPEAIDYRRRGCSRWEVLGDNGTPSIAWNESEVAETKLALAQDPGYRPRRMEDELDDNGNPVIRSRLPDWCSKKSHAASIAIQRLDSLKQTDPAAYDSEMADRFEKYFGAGVNKKNFLARVTAVLSDKWDMNKAIGWTAEDDQNTKDSPF